ncbi:hypothetical protein GGI21_005046 [Coemansia aciculifera]|uniref:Uncharacterized protein n=1 Tax=Coemansia aciculifera TaxID=417176 RepID=A0ACC1M9H6_9FUNG|nr:hypothetical protein GGI21_005046 [Coemansia aciculifera]KAJ2900227.1 hypothetical protein IWW38_000647 [Coemansia aciculifera]
MSSIYTQLIIPRLETMAQCQLSLIKFGNCVYFFYNPNIMSEYYLTQEIREMARHADIKQYKCFFYDMNKVQFHKGKLSTDLAIGVLFYHQMECRAVSDTFDMETFVETLEKLPTLDELSVAKAKAKAKEDAKAAAKKVTAPIYNPHPKDYNFNMCVIL